MCSDLPRAYNVHTLNIMHSLAMMLNVSTKSQPIYTGDIYPRKMYYLYHVAKDI